MEDKYIKRCKDLIDFISKSPTCYQVVDNIKTILLNNNFIELKENEKFNVKSGKSYFVTRNNSSLIAFKIPKKYNGFSIISSHTDSPNFKLKANPEITKEYTTLNVEGYGGMLCSTWFDRALSIAGRVFYQDNNKIVEKLINFDKDLVSIVNLAIHQNRTVNDGYAYKKQKDMLPIIGIGNKKDVIKELISKELSIEKGKILDFDLFLYNRQKAKIWGVDDEFFSSPQIDDLQGVFTSLTSLVETEAKSNINMAVFLDNEEVGSGTRQGALSDFIKVTVDRIANSLNWDVEDKAIYKANSFMISCDNGHAYHPNYGEKSDIVNKPILNNGVLIKYSANQKYTTDGFSSSFLKSILKKENIPYQEFVNHSDIAGGSTLGNLVNRNYSIPTIDIGASQLAMHSSYETGGTKDTYYLIKAMKEFYSR